MPEAKVPVAQLGLVRSLSARDRKLTRLQVVGSRADETTWAGCTLPDAPVNYVWVVGDNG